MNLQGLTLAQVESKIREGKVNHVPHKQHNTITRIILKNTLTIFNLVNLVLAIMVLLVGSYKNLLFIIIAIANTLISIINEIRAKHTIDKLKLISEQNPTVIREGKTIQIPAEDLVEGDLVIFSLGDQIIVDARVEAGTVEVNESYITGEQRSVAKNQGDKLISGSFVVSGTCKATVTAVGAKSEIAKLEQNAHTIKTANSKLFSLMNNIVKYISFALIPIGALLLWSRFRVENTTTEIAVTSTVAALINMIPEGLILLTSSVLALATIRLSKKKVLVQDLYSIETLARVDTIALDKTGTLTTGNMTVHDFILPDGTTLDKPSKSPTPAEKSFLSALNAILSHQTAENATTTALKRKFLKTAKSEPTEQILETISFSSERKHSGIKTKDATYLLGAIDFVTDDPAIIKQVKDASGPYRTLAVIKHESISEEAKNGLSKGVRNMPENVHSRPSATNEERVERARPVTTAVGAEQAESLLSASRRRPADDLWSTGESERVENEPFLAYSDQLLGFIRLEDEIRPDAKQIIDYFYDNNIDVKIISGDDLDSVRGIASRVGIKDLKGLNLSDEPRPNYNKLVKDYSIFTRVTPSQKKELIKALKKQGSTVAMTGDGVNDILAMKEADVSLAIGEGSDAARRSAKMVLLSSDFSAVPSIIDEGRQSINNLERSTALFLTKTIYASILAVIFVFLPFNYPFTPIEMSLLNFACIGFPGLVLALEKNTDRIKNRFIRNILTYSFPVGLTVSICMAALSIVSHLQGFTHHELTTISVFVTFTIDLILIYWLSRPLTPLRAGLFFTIIGIMVAAFAIPLIREFFEFVILSPANLIVLGATIVGGLILFFLLKTLMSCLSNRLLGPSNL